MSAIIPEDAEGTPEQIKVLFTMHEGLDALDLAGPLEILSNARHNIKDADTKAFDIVLAGDNEMVTTAQGLEFRSHMTFQEARKRLADFDVVVVPGGNVDAVLKAKAEPLGLIRAFADMQTKNPSRERTLLSVCTGSLLLAQQGILCGLGATTHPDAVTKLESMCQSASFRYEDSRTDVMEHERYVVNNLRFDIDDEQQSQYIRRRSDSGTAAIGGKERRGSAARKGSFSFKQSNQRRESMSRRAGLRLGGLRVITSGGVTTGFDAALYLVGALVSHDSAEEVARAMEYKWQRGVVVDGIDC